MSRADKQPVEKKGKPGRPRAEPKTEFGRWFARENEAGRVTAEEIGELIGCGRAFTSELIQGKKRPRIDAAAAIIRFSKQVKYMEVVDVEFFLPDP